jgi:hypothetical protein
MLPWLTDYKPTSLIPLSGKPLLSRIRRPHSIDATTPLDTSDPKPAFVGGAGVKPRVATAVGGLGLTPVTPAQAQSRIGGDNLPGNHT